jgi:hypothetical protein
MQRGSTTLYWRTFVTPSTIRRRRRRRRRYEARVTLTGGPGDRDREWAGRDETQSFILHLLAMPRSLQHALTAVSWAEHARPLRFLNPNQMPMMETQVRRTFKQEHLLPPSMLGSGEVPGSSLHRSHQEIFKSHQETYYCPKGHNSRGLLKS